MKVCLYVKYTYLNNYIVIVYLLSKINCHVLEARDSEARNGEGSTILLPE